MAETDIQNDALGLEVPVGAIDGELKKLWEADEASTNASLMNFAVYSEDPGSLVANSEMVREFTREHACRAILVAMDRGPHDPEIHSWITAHCHLAHGRKSVCCEQVAFLLRGTASGRLRNTVFAHLASDLPLVFWWQGELSDLFEESLYRLIDRFIFDSAGWKDPVQGFVRLREAGEDARHRIVLQDLEWTRSYHFRLAVAALFDDLVAQRGLPELDRVRIVAQPRHRTAALQLLAWLATQAGWSPTHPSSAEGAADGGESHRFEAKGGKAITAQLDWDPDGAPLALLEIAAPGLTVRVTHEAGAPHLLHRLERAGHVLEQCGPANPDDSAELVADQLSRGGRNSLFRKVWPVFFHLLQGGKG